MAWFGEPWPSAGLRAPICDDDARRVVIPLGDKCQWCGERFTGRSQGVIVPYLSADSVTPEGWHIECMLSMVLPNWRTLAKDDPARVPDVLRGPLEPGEDGNPEAQLSD